MIALTTTAPVDVVARLYPVISQDTTILGLEMIDLIGVMKELPLHGVVAIKVSGSIRSPRSRRRDRDRRSNSHRNGSRDGSVDHKGSAIKQQTEEEKKAERLTKLEAWKKKKAAEKAEQEAGKSPRNALEEIDKKVAERTGVGESKKAPKQSSSDTVSHTPYAGKFDPKVFEKKGSIKPVPAASKLGEEVAIPAVGKSSAALDPSDDLPSADTSTNFSLSEFQKNASPFPLETSKLDSAQDYSRPAANIGSLSLGNKQKNQQEAAQPEPNLNFADDEADTPTLRKLPTLAEDKGTENQDVVAEDEDDAELEDGDTEEGLAAASRAAVAKRDAWLAAQQQDNEQASNDVEMTDIQAQPDLAEVVEAVEAVEAEEEIDPLDAFMATLETRSDSTMPLNPAANNKRKREGEERETYFGDEDTIMEAVDDENDPRTMMKNMANKQKKKKDIIKVDHGKMNYESYRKDFYHEPSELAALSTEEVEDIRHEMDGIKVHGIDPPKPVLKWSHLGLGVAADDVIRKLGFEKPTAIQAQACPAIMSGRDLIGIAKTGSGKTIAFLLPMFRHIKDQRPIKNLEGPIALIIAPTRELATQIHRECKPWAKALNLRAVCAYGGAPIADQIAELKRGCEILVATAGRLIDVLAANNGRVTNLHRVTYLVVDEADRMFDMGFEPQLMTVLNNVRPNRQTVLFSATFPKSMEALARKALTKPIEVIVGGRSVVGKEITQIVEVRTEETKFARLLQLLGEVHQDEDARSLVFVERQESAEDLMNKIMRRGYPCFSIHGGKDQFDRDTVIADFKAGIFPVLCATSVAARGLDVKQLKLVINYDCPNHMEDYVHRAGRTGRAGQLGTAVTFIRPDQEKYALDITKALKASEQPVPEELQELVDIMAKKIKEGTDKASGSGFRGRGLDSLVERRDAERARMRRAYKTGDEPEEETKESEDKQGIKLPEIVVQAKSAPAANADPPPDLLGIDIDAPIEVKRTERPAAGSKSEQLKGVDKVLGAINARLRGAGANRNAPVDNKGPDAGEFHAVLEINDFPQKARWAVTNRTNVAKILEAYGVSITTKGNFFATGAEVPEGQRKLYILVEGDTEVVVTDAMREMKRLLSEGIQADGVSAAARTGGRYSVI